ncbi:MAG: GNAT family N-acetyltransferase [Planctomycetaceae bacterium]
MPNSSGYIIDLWNTIDAVDLAAWNFVREPDDLYNDPRLLKTVEVSMSPNVKFRYLLIRDADQVPVAIAPLFTYAVDGAVLIQHEFLSRICRGLRKIAPFVLRNRTLICGMPFSGAQSHLRIRPEADVAAVLEVFDRQLGVLAKEDRAKYISVKEFGAAESANLSAMENLGYDKADSLPMNVMSIPYDNYNDYLSELPKNKRHEIRRLSRKLQGENLRLVTTSDPDTISRLYTDEVHQLYLAVVARSQTVFEILPAQFFRELARRLPEHCEFTFCLDRQDKVYGFSASLLFGSTYQYMYCGIDYEANPKADIYFNLMNRMVEDAIRQKKTFALVGQNADECKRQKLGTHQESRHFFIKGTRFSTRLILKYFSNILFPARPLSYLPKLEPVPVRADVAQPLGMHCDPDSAIVDAVASDEMKV